MLAHDEPLLEPLQSIPQLLILLLDDLLQLQHSTVSLQILDDLLTGLLLLPELLLELLDSSISIISSVIQVEGCGARKGGGTA